jgi:hypothetical protein
MEVLMRAWIKEQLARATQEIGAELKQMAAHGSHEVSAAIWNGSAFVMYPRGTRDDPQINPVEQEQSQQMDRDI